ncbi:ABC transporter substrate-binding protein [Bordetella petrii]|nr:ABC transporter substrate-binding protein [Bordetella petrii]
MHSILKGLAAGAAVAVAATAVPAHAAEAEIIKLGLSVPLSGAGAGWGKGSEYMCQQAAEEVKAGGGVKVEGKTYNFECIAYDNKYNAAEGAKVARRLLTEDGVKFIGGSLGTAPARALQSMTERQGVLHFTTAWGKSMKGPKYPLTFTEMNTPLEISKPLVQYIKQANPQIKTVALVNPNDATGEETESVANQAWKSTGLSVVSTDRYERGTTEFQPLAAKIAALKPDAVDLCSSPPADAGLILKELAALGWKGVQVVEVGTGAGGLIATGGTAVENTYLGAAITFDGPTATEHQRALDAGVHKVSGDSLNAIQVGFYDAVMALKAAMEKAQSVDPKVVAKTLPTITFKSFYGETSAFGGKSEYGSPQQMLEPVIVTQIKNGKLVELSRLMPEELKGKAGQ